MPKNFASDLGQKYYAPQVQPNRDSNSWPPGHDTAFHVTETTAPTKRLSVTQTPCHILFTVYSRFVVQVPIS